MDLTPRPARIYADLPQPRAHPATVFRPVRAFPSTALSLYAATAVALILLFPALLTSAHWPFVHDAPIIRYIGFLMANGFAPYRDILDMQMPGSYLADSLVVHTLGASRLAWLAWDVINGTLLTLALAWIAGKDRRLHGVIAGILTCLAHLSNGAWFLGQRDWTVAMLIVLSAGCLMHLLRGGRQAWIGVAFLLAGLAATIKPPALLLPAVLLTAIWIHRKRAAIPTPHLALWALAGTVPPFLCVLLFLHRWRAIPAFLAAMSGLIPYYASLHRASAPMLAASAKLALLLLLIAAFSYARNRSWRNLDSNLMLLCALSGLASYLLQGKGFPYHLYPALPFLFLWVVLEIAPPTTVPKLSDAPRIRRTGIGLVAFVSILGLLLLSVESARPYPMTTLNSLETDLTQLGGPTLSHHVQCLDMTLASCINALYRMRLVQSTGTISDFYLFPDHPTPVTKALQASFLKQVTDTPPRVFILSSQMWPSERLGYTSLASFPQLQTFLQDRYTVAREYTPEAKDTAGYRLYIYKEPPREPTP